MQNGRQQENKNNKKYFTLSINISFGENGFSTINNYRWMQRIRKSNFAPLKHRVDCFKELKKEVHFKLD